MVRHDRFQRSPPMGLDRRAARQTSAGHSSLEALVEKLRTSHGGREGSRRSERLQAHIDAAAGRRHDGRAEGSDAATEGGRSSASQALTKAARRRGQWSRRMVPRSRRSAQPTSLPVFWAPPWFLHHFLARSSLSREFSCLHSSRSLRYSTLPGVI